ncbi:hypothetical protein ACIA8G_18555 [Lentzea sp. NPDC051213]|uniref:hypothetical protein n=1 Tax=Lentzea sp. NPDC051213 TaxID=3364126 RepID=UPI0037BD1417
MFSHHDAFAIAKQRQCDFEADAAMGRLEKKSKEVVAKPERRRLRLFVRVRPA